MGNARQGEQNGQFGIYLFELEAQPGGPWGGQLKKRAQGP
jgi:hypothetical protein